MVRLLVKRITVHTAVEPEGKVVRVLIEYRFPGVVNDFQHEAGRIGDGACHPADGDHFVFQRLAQRLQGGVGEFRQLIQEQNPPVAHGDLAGS